MMQIQPAQFLADTAAALAVVRHAGRVGVVGYCWGGTVAYLAACELPVACAVSYYGGGTVNFLDREPKVPVLYHFGEQDTHIPLENVEKIKAAHPNGIYYLYPAGHGFNCTDRSDYNPESASVALTRTLAFLAQHVDPRQ